MTNSRDHTLEFVIAFAGAILILVWRWYQSRLLVFPAWVDSVHHVLLTRILVENRLNQLTWEPYLHDSPFYYHFGFHAAAALTALATGITPRAAVLSTGLCWHAVLGGSIYLLGRAIGLSRVAAFTALLFAGLVTYSPAIYIAWGRYPLVAGLALACLTLASMLHKRWVLAAFLAILTSVTHIFGIALVLGYSVLHTLTATFTGEQPQSRTVMLILSPSLLWPTYAVLKTVAIFGHDVITPSIHAVVLSGAGQILAQWPSNLVLAMGACAAVWQLARQRRHVHAQASTLVPMAFLLAGLFAYAAIGRIGIIRSDHAAILLFLPASILAADAVWRLAPAFPALLLAAALLVAGTVKTYPIVKPIHIIADQDDAAMLAWIAQNTDKNAAFLVDVSPWAGNMWRGIDGGWWISAETGRRTVPPPIAYAWGGFDNLQEVSRVSEELYRLPSYSREEYCSKLELIMQMSQIDYYYTRNDRPGLCPYLHPEISIASVTLYRVSRDD